MSIKIEIAKMQVPQFFGLRDLGFKKLKKDPPKIDNKIFVLHYRITFYIILACSSFILYDKYTGEPVSCSVSSAFSEKYVNSYCWIEGMTLRDPFGRPGNPTFICAFEQQ